MPFAKGAEHPKWRGGVHVNEEGYLRISAGPLRGKYVHILIMEAKLGRKLNPKVEDVHHKNGNKLDCSPDNLELQLKDLHGSISGHRCE